MDQDVIGQLADNRDKQVCYFNKPNDDVFYNTLISEGIYFKIEKVRGKTDKENFEAKRTLGNGASDAGTSEFFADSESEQNGAGTKRHRDSFEHLFRKYRRTTRPKFLAG